MRNRALLALVLPFLLAQGCDYVDDPIAPADGGNNGGEGVTRRVLIEDLTGHTCNNCPGAAQVAADLQEFYGEEQLIVVGVHGGGFSAPVAPIGDGIYDTDFRTPAGTEYNQAFQVMFWPAGMVSRREVDGSVVLSEGAWSTAVADIIGQPSPFELWFETLITGTNTVSTTIKLHLTEAVSDDHTLVVYLTEDHVIDWQTDSGSDPPDVPDYDHRHVLRTNLNGTWGVPVITDSAAAGDTITLEYEDFALNPSWNMSNCALVAYVRNTSTEEVMQAAERKFQP